ncbi:hypothetical protein MMC13_007646 [Lambiella insularis]|nr:hypothetical protein [Lambiella insularis]
MPVTSEVKLQHKIQDLLTYEQDRATSNFGVTNRRPLKDSYPSHDEQKASQLFEPSELVAMIPISAEQFLPFHIPPVLLVQPVATQELPDASVIRLSLRRFQGHELVEIFVDDGRLA